MSRAAFLPFPGDPFLLHYWLKLFAKTWINEVDRLYIAHNSAIEPEVAEYIEDLAHRIVGDKLTFLYTSHQTDHGLALNEMLDICGEDHVLLVEDDGFIFKPGVVRHWFNMLEVGRFDIIGSKRESCSQEILDKAAEKWGLSYAGLGDQGPNFWPCFFFAAKKTLLETDRNFCARAWDLGQTIEPLDYVVDVDRVVGDTFVNTSLQLRAKFPQNRIHCIPQWHGSPNDIDDYENRRYLFDGQAYWCHIGSLSSGVGGVLCNDEGYSLSRKQGDPAYPGGVLPEWCNSEGERNEWERRVQWWLTFWENREEGKIEKFAEEYRTAIDRIIRQFNLRMKTIRRRQEIYTSMGMLSNAKT